MWTETFSDDADLFTYGRILCSSHGNIHRPQASPAHDAWWEMSLLCVQPCISVEWLIPNQLAYSPRGCPIVALFGQVPDDICPHSQGPRPQELAFWPWRYFYFFVYLFNIIVSVWQLSFPWGLNPVALCVKWVLFICFSSHLDMDLNLGSPLLTFFFSSFLESSS